ncbi:biotin-dependent carboxyltransferase family protein [Olivibacter sitiensis]|uniref:5-oxoprolinase subunit C family protein n=1 Tax=Olivibacter sitiensis TaxID=376470 RepID=UPI000407BBFF|nr:biotin-dependent carboxyltransferase family protein [Olivibacter sitiensis]
MRISILKPGPLSTIQDHGRHGYRQLGVPLAGCMDKVAATIANLLVGNKGHEAVIEMIYSGMTFIADTPLLIACCGGGSKIMVDGQKIPLWTPLFIPQGTTVKCMPDDQGCIAYIAIAGGWDVPEILGSYSTYLPAQIGGFHGRALQKEDELSNNTNISALSGRILLQLHQSNQDINHPKWYVNAGRFVDYGNETVRYTEGLEYDWFDEKAHQALSTARYFLDRQSNRMGYRLAGQVLRARTEGHELLSTAVMPGTVQVTKSGEIILLMADCQTTGGYPRIAQVIQVDIPICVQLKLGEAIRFEKVSLTEAENLYLTQQKQLAALGNTIRKLFA